MWVVPAPGGRWGGQLVTLSTLVGVQNAEHLYCRAFVLLPSKNTSTYTMMLRLR